MLTKLRQTLNFLENEFSFKNSIKFGLNIIVDVCVSTCEVTKIYLMSSLVESVFQNASTTESTTNDSSLLIHNWLVPGLIIIEGTRSVLPYFKYKLTGSTHETIQGYIFSESMAEIYADPLKLLNDRHARNEVYKTIFETERYGINLSTILVDQIIPKTIDFSINYLVLSSKNHLFYVSVPIYCAARFYLDKKMRAILDIETHLSEITQLSIDLRRKLESDIENIQLITLSNKVLLEYEQLKAVIQKYIKSQYKYEASSQKMSLFNNIASYTLKLLLLYLFSNQKNSYTDAIIFFMYIDNFDNKVKALSESYFSLEKSVEHIISLQHALPSEQNRLNKSFANILKNPETLLKQNAFEICFDDVYFRYDKASDFILKGLTFTIEKGKTTGILGISGVGKSTIVKLICGLVQPERGKILINGINLKHVPLPILHRLFGVLTQNAKTLDDLSIEENIFYSSQAKPKNASNKAANLLKRVGIFNVKLDQPCSNLSGGQKQRIGIARVLAKQPKIVIMDEYTSELDSFMEATVMETFNHLVKNSTALIVGHRLATIQSADKIIVIGENGKIIQNGTHDNLMADKKGFYYQSWLLQTSMKSSINYSKCL